MNDEYKEKDYNKVTNLMLNLKFKPQMQGFDYIRSAVLYYLKSGSISNITTEVYPVLAKIYGTREQSIERSIRLSIENAYSCSGFLSLNEYFGAIVYTNKFRYSNSEIIAIMVEVIKLDRLRKSFCGIVLDNMA